MKVLWWLPEFPPDPGGIGTFAVQVAGPLARRGHDLLLVSHSTTDEPRHRLEPGIELVRLPTRTSLQNGDSRAVLAVRRRIIELKHEFQADLYHVHLCEGSPVLHLSTSHAHPAPTVLTLHNELSTMFGSREDTLYGRLLAASGLVTTVSAAARDELLQQRPELGAKVLVVSNGIATGAGPAPVPTEPVIVAGGRLSDQKGIDVLLRALPSVIEAVPDASVVVAGDGPLAGELRALADELSVQEHIEWLGQVERDEMPAVFARARAVAMPSRYEGLPYFGLEAAMAGRALVASAIGGVVEVVVDGETGLLTPVDDPGALAGALVRVLTEPTLAERLGDAARARVLERFSVEAAADLYDEAYRRLGGDRRQPRVSVVMPAFDSERTVGEAVRSVLDQTATDLELVVVDDGSHDGTAAAAASGDPRVCVVSQPNSGTAGARNAGLALASGELVTFLDADDRWPRDRLARLLEALDADDRVQAAFGSAVEFHDDSTPLGARMIAEPFAVRMPTTGLFRRPTIELLGPFRHSDVGEGIDFVSRLIDSGTRYEAIPDVVLERRVHDANKGIVMADRHVERIAVLKASLDRRRSRSDTRRELGPDDRIG